MASMRGWRSRRRIVLALSTAVALALAIWSFWIEPSSHRVVPVALRVPRWHEVHRDLKIAVMADLHVGSPHYGLAKYEEILDAVRREDPDLILVAGDLVIHGVIGGSFVDPEAIASMLGRLTPRLGTIAVLGNHDWWYDGAAVRAALLRHGIVVLENRPMRVTDRGASFWIAGLEDLMTRPQDIAGTIAQIPDGEVILALTHNPDVFVNMPARVSLTIAGHTHGGQVRLPRIGAPVVPSSYGQRFVAGHIVEQGRHLFVTTGLGTSIFPVRFRVPPEIVMLSLSAGG